MPTFDGFKGNNGFLVTIREEETQRSKTIAKEYSTIIPLLLVSAATS